MKSVVIGGTGLIGSKIVALLRYQGSVKRLLCSLLVATLPFGGALADPPKSKNAKAILV